MIRFFTKKVFLSQRPTTRMPRDYMMQREPMGSEVKWRLSLSHDAMGTECAAKWGRNTLHLRSNAVGPDAHAPMDRHGFFLPWTFSTVQIAKCVYLIQVSFYTPHQKELGPFNKLRINVHVDLASISIFWRCVCVCNAFLLTLVLLPPAYVVRREGTVFTGVCLSTGGGGGGPVRYPPPRGPGTPPGGYRSPGTPPGGSGYPPPGGGTEVRVPPLGGYQGQVPPLGGTKVRVPPGGVRVPPQGGYWSLGTPRGGTRVRYPPQGGYLTRVGQQKEYSLHGGRYASCVHAGGLSCLDYKSM